MAGTYNNKSASCGPRRDGREDRSKEHRDNEAEASDNRTTPEKRAME